MNPTREELAYIAGFFDGEGSASFVYRKATKNGKLYGKLEASLSQNQRPILEWVQYKMQCGTVHLSRCAGRPDQYSYKVAYRAARKFLTAILPFLHVKRSTVEAKLALDAKVCRPNRCGRKNTAYLVTQPSL